MNGIRTGWLALLVAGLAACGGGGSTPEPAVVLTSCNPVAQTGCSAGKKCTWIRINSSTSTGALGCTPAGTVNVGGACQYGADGEASGYDDCRGGEVCLAPGSSAAQGTCQRICDSSNVLSCTPSSQWACSTYGGYFASGGAAPVAGLCTPQCDPLTQVRLSDGAAACGSPNPATPTLACYGRPGGGGAPTVFTCASAGPSTMTDRQPISGTVYLNSCAPGHLPLMVESTGSTTVICSALCSPADTTLASHPAPGGVAPYGCPGTDECRYWWWLEDAGTPVTAWSNGLGFCIDYTYYTYGTPAVTFPSCTTLSSTAHNFDPTLSDATYWGCTVY
jgi:hypothetical protein